MVLNIPNSGTQAAKRKLPPDAKLGTMRTQLGRTRLGQVTAKDPGEASKPEIS